MFLELNKRSNCTPETSRDCDVAWGKTPDSVHPQICHSLRYFSIRLQRSSCYPQHELQITSTVNSPQSTVVSTPSNPQQSADRSKPLTPQQSMDCSYSPSELGCFSPLSWISPESHGYFSVTSLASRRYFSFASPKSRGCSISDFPRDRRYFHFGRSPAECDCFSLPISSRVWVPSPW